MECNILIQCFALPILRTDFFSGVYGIWHSQVSCGRHIFVCFFFLTKKIRKRWLRILSKKKWYLNTMKNFHVHWLNNKPICNFFSTHYSKFLLKNHYTQKSNEPINFIFLKIKCFLFLGINHLKTCMNSMKSFDTCCFLC